MQKCQRQDPVRWKHPAQRSCGIPRQRKIAEWIGISRKHIAQPKCPPLYHVCWLHAPPPTADFPLCPLRCAVCALYSPFFRGRGSLYALRVNNCVAGACVSPCFCPHPVHQRRTDLLPKPASDCGVIKISYCGVWWKVMGQISPFAALVHKI